MKTIRVKSYNKLIEKIINEDSIRLDGNTSDYKGKLKKRITDAIRLAKECKIAAKKARDDGNIVDAEWLEKRAEDYETAAKTWNQDALDAEEDNLADSKDKEPSQSEVAQDAANAAKRAARDAQDAANEAQNNAKKLADAGHDASAAQAAADKAQEKADEAKKAAEEAQEHADEASKAEAAGDKDKAKAEAEAAEDAQNKAEQAASEANEATEAANQKSASERAKDAAEAAEEAAKNTQAKAAAAQKKADDLKAEGKDASDAQAEADKAKEKANEAKKAAEEAKDHAEKAEKAEKSGDTETANSEADKAEAAADGAKQAANSLSDDSEDVSSDSGGVSDSDGESSSDSDNDSKSDGSSDSDSDSGKGSDSGSDSGDDSDSDDDSDDNSDADSDNDENQSDNTPVKDIFADDEDIPSMPSKGQQGQDPRDPTIDEIIKQLSKLNGEAKRGAVDGLTDLVKKNKNESLAEAFSKGIREFSDEEWDDLNDETIDKINKIKQITTIDDVEGRKAKVKSWADNQVSRQELSDEESQNAQHDVLQRRAKEQELDKYNNLSGIKDFELDFEGCIRDQVELVMQDYLTYDEINPEYELEDVIMKTEVQRMIPDEAIPTIAVFFDKSGSCKYAIPTLNNAIATVKKKYVDTGMCKLDLYYFGDRVAYNDANAYVGGSTEAWPHIIETIKQGDYNNVIVMSDDDIENQNNHGESYTVTGCVWWLWVNGIRADKCVKELRGMQHNCECEISAY